MFSSSSLVRQQYHQYLLRRTHRVPRCSGNGRSQPTYRVQRRHCMNLNRRNLPQ